MSELATPARLRRGAGAPLTARGRSVAYGPPPWRMSGRTLAIWYLMADPDEVRRHVPLMVHTDPDPVVRVRFWDLTHDGDIGSAGADGRGRLSHFREAVVAFPVRFGDVEGDYPTYMYADDFTYTAFGREQMGWPVRDGTVSLSPPADLDVVTGTRLEGSLERHGRLLMRASATLTGSRLSADDAVPPKWLALKVVPDVAEPRAVVGQLVASGPSSMSRAEVWDAVGTLELYESPSDELHFLQPREIVAAQYWTGVELTVERGRVLAELGDEAWDSV